MWRGHELEVDIFVTKALVVEALELKPKPSLANLGVEGVEGS